MAEKKPRPEGEPEIDLQFELVDEAFQLQPDDRMAIEKKILAVAFLLEACTHEGNDPVDGIASCGFAQILRECARDVTGLRRQLRPKEE
jgi:hypothetical protein